MLRAIEPPTLEQVREMAVRAQYGPGTVGGERVPGYLEEDGVPPDSRTETYAALRLQVQNWRWAGVPFYLRTGKRLARKVTEIAITLKPVPHLAFRETGSLGVQPNQLILTVQPDEGVSLSLGAKIPGNLMRIRPVNMEFHYGTAFLSQSPEAYERLILDAMRGDASLFTRDDEVEAQWSIYDPILEAWHDGAEPLPQYPAGTDGPGGGQRAARARAPLEAALSDDIWSQENCTPTDIEAALRGLLSQRATESGGVYAPARVLNLIVIVDREWRGEIANRLEQVGRYSASRTIMCVVEQGRDHITAWARMTAPDARPPPGEIAPVREQIEIDVGPQHLPVLDTVVDPVVVPELLTVLWSPHGHDDAVDALLRRIVDVILVDSVVDPDPEEALHRVEELSEKAYIVDLAWLRSTPWRERVAATFDPRGMREALRHISGVTVRYRPDSEASAFLYVGWLASRLGWRVGKLGGQRRRPARTRPRAPAGGRAAPPAPSRAGRARAGRGDGGDGQRAVDLARPRRRRPDRAPARARRLRAHVEGPGRLARRGRDPRPGRAPGPAARPDLQAGAGRGACNAALMRVIESPIDGELLTAANEEELRAAVRRHYQEHKPDAVPTDEALDVILADAYDAMDS